MHDCALSDFDGVNAILSHFSPLLHAFASARSMRFQTLSAYSEKLRFFTGSPAFIPSVFLWISFSFDAIKSLSVYFENVPG